MLVYQRVYIANYWRVTICIDNTCDPERFLSDRSRILSFRSHGIGVSSVKLRTKGLQLKYKMEVGHFHLSHQCIITDFHDVFPILSQHNYYQHLPTFFSSQQKEHNFNQQKWDDRTKPSAIQTRFAISKKAIPPERHRGFDAFPKHMKTSSLKSSEKK